MKLDLELMQYITQNSTQEADLLKELERETHQKTTQANMISGYLQGRILSFISKIYQPKNILEIGTFTGYATLCLAEGLTKDGTITTIDCNDELRYLSEKYFRKSQFSSQIKYIHGNALEVIASLDTIFDLVFIDADKENYQNYFQLLQHKLHVGSIILADNVLWYGKVLDESINDKKTSSIRQFNQFITKCDNFENIILPIRDGINVIRKIK